MTDETDPSPRPRGEEEEVESDSQLKWNEDIENDGKDKPNKIAKKKNVQKRQMKKAKDSSNEYWSKRVLIDTAVGVTAGLTLAWMITPMDICVMESMNGRRSIAQSLKRNTKRILTEPHKYAIRPEYRIVSLTYGATYLSKNWSDSLCIKLNLNPELSAFLQFWGVFLVNGGISVFWKDPKLAQLVSDKNSEGKKSKRSKRTSFPAMTKRLWVAREVFHVTGAVILPDYLEKKLGWSREEWRRAQLTFPLMTQSVTAMFHILGLDYAFHRSNASFWKERLPRCLKLYPSAALIRGIRMFVPWSLGLIVNRDLRDKMLSRIAEVDT